MDGLGRGREGGVGQRGERGKGSDQEEVRQKGFICLFLFFHIT